MKHKFLNFFLVFFLLIFTNTSIFAKEKTIIYERTNDSITLEPSKIRDLYSAEVSFNIYEGLVSLDNKTLQIKPCLAKKWDIHKNGKIWVFYLRKGIKFHNGQELTAKSVKYTFQHIIKEKKKEKKFYMVKSLISKIKITGKYTIKIYLKKPYAPFLIALTDMSFFIIPENNYEKKVYKQIGTGPFMFHKWNKDKFLILKKNNNYWGSKIKLDKIIYRVEQDSYSRLLHIKNKSSDLLILRSKEEEESLASVSHIKYLNKQTPQVTYLGFNVNKSPFNNSQIRKAFAYSINKKQLVRYIFQDLAIPISSFLPPNMMSHINELYKYEYDIDKTRLILKKLNFPEEIELKLVFGTGNNALKELSNRISRNLARFGIKIKLIEAPFKQIIDKIEKGNFDMFLLTYLASPDPDLYLTPNFTKNGQFNHTGYYKPELTELLNKARKEFNKDKRKFLYKKVITILNHDLPVIPLYSETCVNAYNKKIKKLSLHPFGIILFKDAYIKE